jgi:hypothetical protein
MKPATAKKPTASRLIAMKPTAAVIAKYTESGWTASLAPKGSINDVIAQKNGKYHFIQVITGGPPEDSAPKTDDLAKNTFIQNAFSNGAIPVHAYVTSAGTTLKISLQDVNTCTRLIVGRATPKAPGDEPSKATPKVATKATPPAKS